MKNFTFARKSASILIGTIAALIGAQSAQANSIYTFSASNGTLAWSDSANGDPNWDYSPPPAAGSTTTTVQIFGGVVSPIGGSTLISGDPSAFTVNRLTLNGLTGNNKNWGVVVGTAGKNWTFTGTSATVDLNGLNQNNGVLTTIFNPNLVLNANTAFQGNGNEVFKFTGVISGASGLTKSGTSALTLSGSNTFIGGLTLNAGQLNIDGAQALGTGTLTIAGGTMDSNVTGGAVSAVFLPLVSVANPNNAVVNLNNNAQNWNGNLTFTGTNALDLGTGAVTMSASRAVTVSANTLAVGGVISGGTFALTKAGTGALLLSGANIYGGSTAVNVGTLNVTNASGLGTGVDRNLTVSARAGLNYMASADAPLDISGGLAFTGGTGSSVGGSIGSTTTSAQISVGGNAIATASTAVNIFGISGVNAISGNYTLIGATGGGSLNAATYTLGKVFNASSFTVGTLSATATTLHVGITAVAPQSDLYWKGGFSGGVNQWAVSDGSTTGNWSASALGAVQSLVPGAATNVHLGVASPTAQGSMVLGANMTIDRLTAEDTINVVGLRSDVYCLTLKPANPANGIVVNADAQAVTISAPLVLGATQTWTNQSAQALVLNSPSITGAFGLTVAGSGNTILSAPLLTGVGTLTKGGAGTLVLAAANSFTGATTVNGGNLIATGRSALSGSPSVAVASGAAFGYAASVDASLTITGTLGVAGGSGTRLGGSIGSAITSAQINVTGAATTSGAIAVDVYGTSATPSSGLSATSFTLVHAASGLNGATYSLGNIYNNTNFIVGAPTVTGTDLKVPITSATANPASYWKGGFGGATNVWAISDGSASSNWVTSGGVDQRLVPGSGTAVTFGTVSPTSPATASVLGADMKISGLTISDTSNGMKLLRDGHALTIGSGGITISAGVPASTMGADIVLNASQLWVNQSANPLTVSGNISGNLVTGVGNISLATEGSGQVILTGVSNINGDVMIQSSSSLVIKDGGKLTNQGNGGSTGICPQDTGDNNSYLLITGDGSNFTTTNRFNMAVNGHRSGNYLKIEKGGSANIGESIFIGAAGADITNQAVYVQDSGSVLTVASEIVFQAGKDGGDQISGNKLWITNGGVVNTLSASIAGVGTAGGPHGSLFVNAAGGVEIKVNGSGSQLNLASSLKMSSATAVAGSNLMVSDGGKLQIGTAQNNECLTLGKSDGSSNNNRVTVDTSGVLQFTTATPSITIYAPSGNALTMNGATLAYKSAFGVDMGASKVAGVGIGKFTWSGINTLRLDGTVSNTSESGSGAYTFANNLGAANYATLELYGVTAISRGLTFDGNNGGALLLNGATSSFSGGINLIGAVTVTAQGVGSGLTGVITGTGALTLGSLSTSALTLKSLSNYSGATTVNKGTLKAGVSSFTGLGGAFGLDSLVTINSGAFLEITGFDTQIGGLSGGGTVNLGSETLTVNATDSTSFAGAIRGAGGTSGTLLKKGAGTLSLSGVQAYDTLTTDEGMTIVNSAVGTGGSTVNLSAGATMKFGTVSQTISALNIEAGAVVTFTSGLASFGGLGKSLGGSSLVPEPGSVGLLLVGALGVLSRRRRQG